MFKVVEQISGQGWKDGELQAMAGLCQGVFSVIALLGLSADLEAEKQMEARAQALEGAKGVDKVTQGVWGLEAWVKVLLEGQGQKDLEL